MQIFFIRHGETVDNVAGLYAGVRDSPLTVHGNLQAEKLANYFAGKRFNFTHVFASNLQRAYKTANALRAVHLAKEHNVLENGAKVVQVEALREQDFGIYEGKPFYARSQGSYKSGKAEHRQQHQDEPGFQDVESRESMATRANTFLDNYLLPILVAEEEAEKTTVAVVSHGIMLSSLWRCFLKRFPKNSIALSPDVSLGGGPAFSLKHLGGWSNTGYLELEVSGEEELLPATLVAEDEKSLYPAGDAEEEASQSLAGFKMTIKTINGKGHLKGFKRTRGVGSSQFDEGQKKIETFFKKPRIERHTNVADGTDDPANEGKISAKA